MKDYNFLVSTYTDKDILAHTPKGKAGIGIYHISIDDKGILNLENIIDITPNIAFISRHPELPLLYACTETIDKDGELITLEIKKNYSLEIKNKTSSCGKSSCYINIYDKNLYLSNYWDASIAKYSIDNNGDLLLAKKINLPGSKYVIENSPSRKEHWQWRQKWSHAHCIVREPYLNKYLFIVDLGSDKIIMVDEDLTTISETSVIKKSGPRHIIFHPKFKILYVVNELNSTVSVFSVNLSCVDSPIKLIQTISCLPDTYDNKLIFDEKGWHAQSHSGEIRIHPSLKFLFVSNRGHNSITTFIIQNNGKLEIKGHFSSGGITPRNFNFSLDGEWLIVGNQDSNLVSSFKINQSNGDLTLIDNLEIPSPNYIYTL